MHSAYFVLYLGVLIVSVIIHEIMHGLAAHFEGDMTPRNAGRLSANPLRHIDPVGSILLPLVLILTHAGFIIGWAKHVPCNERNFRNQKSGPAIVASAGILANICLALIFGAIIRYAAMFGGLSHRALLVAETITLVNLLLALWNSIPIPPLDGAKIIFALMPRHTTRMQMVIEHYSVPILIIAVIFLWPYIFPAVNFLFTLITGHPVPVA